MKSMARPFNVLRVDPNPDCQDNIEPINFKITRFQVMIVIFIYAASKYTRSQKKSDFTQS